MATLANMTIYTSKSEKIELSDSPFAAGGEGAIYKVESAPIHLQNVCVKIYHSHIVNKLREDRIKYMVANPPSQIRGEGFMLGWPMDYVTDADGKFLGFVMPLGFSDSKELVNLTATTLSKNLGQEWQERYDRSLGKKALLSRLKLICNIAIPVHILHATGKYVLKDFKPQNVLSTADGRITICDMDSIQIADGGNLLFSGTAATPDYMPPEFYSKGIGKKATDVISESWDTFAMGVVFYQLLFGIHPYVVTPKEEQDDGANSISSNISSGLFPFGVNGDMVKIRPKLHDKFMVLPQELQDLFVKTFSDEESKRPSAEDWGRYIYQIITISNANSPIGTNGASSTGNKGNSESTKGKGGTVETGGSSPKKSSSKVLRILFALLLIAVLGFLLYDYSTKDEAPYTDDNIEEVNDTIVADFVDEVTDVQEENPPKHEEFQTRQFSMSEERDNLTELEIDIDYPVKGGDALVYSIRKFINQTLSTKMDETPYDGDLSDGGELLKYYYDCAASNPEMDIEIEFEVLYESDKFVSYFYMIESYLKGDVHGNDAIGGATFVKDDGSIVDWGMFKNDSEMQYQIKKGMESFYGSGNYNNDYTPFPKVGPVLLKDAVKFFYNRYELGGSYADGTPTFSIPYADIKDQMKSTVAELIE